MSSQNDVIEHKTWTPRGLSFGLEKNKICAHMRAGSPIKVCNLKIVPIFVCCHLQSDVTARKLELREGRIFPCKSGKALMLWKFLPPRHHQFSQPPTMAMFSLVNSTEKIHSHASMILNWNLKFQNGCHPKMVWLNLKSMSVDFSLANWAQLVEILVFPINSLHDEICDNLRYILDSFRWSVISLNSSTSTGWSVTALFCLICVDYHSELHDDIIFYKQYCFSPTKLYHILWWAWSLLVFVLMKNSALNKMW